MTVSQFGGCILRRTITSHCRGEACPNSKTLNTLPIPRFFVHRLAIAMLRQIYDNLVLQQAWRPGRPLYRAPLGGCIARGEELRSLWRCKMFDFWTLIMFGYKQGMLEMPDRSIYWWLTRLLEVTPKLLPQCPRSLHPPKDTAPELGYSILTLTFTRCNICIVHQDEWKNISKLYQY